MSARKCKHIYTHIHTFIYAYTHMHTCSSHLIILLLCIGSGQYRLVNHTSLLYLGITNIVHFRILQYYNVQKQVYLDLYKCSYIRHLCAYVLFSHQVVKGCYLNLFDLLQSWQATVIESCPLEVACHSHKHSMDSVQTLYLAMQWPTLLLAHSFAVGAPIANGNTGLIL